MASPESETLNPQALNPQPGTLKPKPSPLNPEPKPVKPHALLGHQRFWENSNLVAGHRAVYLKEGGFPPKEGV